jgi:hypothetical protein
VLVGLNYDRQNCALLRMMDQAVKILASVLGYSFGISSGTPTNVTEIFRGFHQSLQVTFRIMPQITSPQFSYTFFSNLLFTVIQYSHSTPYDLRY